eukprot:Pompholyxophrys_punicea_v1_NODE_522_length_1776_cov_4.365374.p1 type:complete len:100 gc:universal NODE_522_length_1776_cov_4.365374:1064-1363(+)
MDIFTCRLRKNYFVVHAMPTLCGRTSTLPYISSGLPMDHLAIDLAGPMPTSPEGKNYLSSRHVLSFYFSSVLTRQECVSCSRGTFLDYRRFWTSEDRSE